MDLHIHSLKYQRNGICGAGFYAIRFDWRDDAGKLRRMIGHVHPDDEREPVYYGVTDIDEPELAWRGDHFVDDLQAAIKRHEAELDARLMTAEFPAA